MKRSLLTAAALTLGLAVSAAVVVTVFAQKKQTSSASHDPDPDTARTAAPASSSMQSAAPMPAQAPPPSEKAPERRSERSGSLTISVTEENPPSLSRTRTEKRPEIEFDSSNIRAIPKSSVQPIVESRREIRLTSDRPESSLAAKIADPEAETVSIWRPAYATQGFRGARLDAFEVSGDGSVLAIAERTGAASGPNGTRIVLVDTSDWQVVRILTTERLLKNLAFVPGRTELAALAYPQTSLKQPFGLQFFDVKSGNETVFRELPFQFNEKIEPDRVALLAADNGVFCSGFFGSKVFFVPYDLPPKTEPPYFSFETVSPASALAVTPDGESLAAVSLKAIEYFDIEVGTDGAKRLSITTLDLGWAPVYLQFLGGARTDFIVCPAYQEDSPPVIVRSSARESLDGRSAGFAVPMDGGKQIGVAFKVKGRIDVIDPASLDASDSIILEQLRPATSGDTAFVFYLDSIRAFCIVDSVGNCFAVSKRDGEKRWAKRIIWNGAGKR